MAEFEKQNSKVGHVLMIKNLRFGLFQKLNPKQEVEALKAIDSLIEKRFITLEGRSTSSECLKLTELGYNSLYQNSKNTDNIQSMILEAFEKQKSKAGHILMLKNLNIGLFQKLNPVEKELVNDAIGKLIEKGFIKYEDGSSGLECLRLTELGFENLYN